MVPFFSVVIPTFNRANKLKKTLKSVLTQSFTNFEVLVMDDGSTDDTFAVVNSFCDLRIHYHWAPNSGGPAAPRNRGIDIAVADWVCFLDADDIWYLDKLQHVFSIISQQPNIDLICHNEFLNVIQTDSRSVLKYGPFVPDFYRVMLLHGNRVSTSATTVRRSFINQHLLRFNQSPDYVIVEDYDFWLRIAFEGAHFYFSNSCLGEYIIENDNISSNLPLLQRNLSVLLRDHVYSIQKFELDKDKLWREINAGLLISATISYLKLKKFRLACTHLLAANTYSCLGSLRYLIAKLVTLSWRAFTFSRTS